VLADSCKDIFNASEKAGYSYIGALKTNRVIFPQGHERLGIKLNKFKFYYIFVSKILSLYNRI